MQSRARILQHKRALPLCWIHMNEPVTPACIYELGISFENENEICFWNLLQQVEMSWNGGIFTTILQKYILQSGNIIPCFIFHICKTFAVAYINSVVLHNTHIKKQISVHKLPLIFSCQFLKMKFWPVDTATSEQKCFKHNNNVEDESVSF